jgi:hypothetical protein
LRGYRLLTHACGGRLLANDLDVVVVHQIVIVTY